MAKLEKILKFGINNLQASCELWMCKECIKNEWMYNIWMNEMNMNEWNIMNIWKYNMNEWNIMNV